MIKSGQLQLGLNTYYKHELLYNEDSYKIRDIWTDLLATVTFTCQSACYLSTLIGYSHQSWCSIYNPGWSSLFLCSLVKHTNCL